MGQNDESHMVDDIYLFQAETSCAPRAAGEAQGADAGEAQDETGDSVSNQEEVAVVEGTDDAKLKRLSTAR